MQYFEESFMEESFEEASETENDQMQSAVPATSNTNSNGQKLTNQKEQASKLCKMPIVRYLLFFPSFNIQIPTATILFNTKQT